MAPTLVNDESEYFVTVTVTRKRRRLVNPNGRGYEADNVTVPTETEMLNSSVVGSSVNEATYRAWAMLSVLREDDPGVDP